MRQKTPKAAFAVVDPNTPDEVRAALKRIVVEKLLSIETGKRDDP